MLQTWELTEVVVAILVHTRFKINSRSPQVTVANRRLAVTTGLCLVYLQPFETLTAWATVHA